MGKYKFPIMSNPLDMIAGPSIFTMRPVDTTRMNDTIHNVKVYFINRTTAVVCTFIRLIAGIKL